MSADANNDDPVDYSKPVDELISNARKVDGLATADEEMMNWMLRVEGRVREDWQIVDDVRQLQNHLTTFYDSVKRETVERVLRQIRKYLPMLREMVEEDYGSRAPYHSYMLMTANNAFLKISPINDDTFMENLVYFDEELADLVVEVMEDFDYSNIEDYAKRVILPNLEKRQKLK